MNRKTLFVKLFNSIQAEKSFLVRQTLTQSRFHFITRLCSLKPIRSHSDTRWDVSQLVKIKIPTFKKFKKSRQNKKNYAFKFQKQICTRRDFLWTRVGILLYVELGRRAEHSSPFRIKTKTGIDVSLQPP